LYFPHFIAWSLENGKFKETRKNARKTGERLPETENEGKEKVVCLFVFSLE